MNKNVTLLQCINPEIPVRYHIRTTEEEQLLAWYRLLFLGRTLDEKAPNYLKQAIGWSYHAPYAGHDGIQLAIGQVFRKNIDFLFPYYRDMLTCLSSGLSSEEIILNGISKAEDKASGGRHMSNHFAKPEWNIQNVSSCTGNHTLHAVGVARSIKYYKHDGVAISSQGESSVSEGYVYEAINGASKEKLPVIFVFQDNGYGISVPKKDQQANRKVADNFVGLKNLKIFHCNGKDVFDSMNTMTEAHQFVKENSMPCIVQANCVRIHSHSNSDKHELYRNSAERNYVATYDPLEKYKRMLLRYNRVTTAQLEEIENEVKLEVKQAHKACLSSADPSPDSIHEFILPDAYTPQVFKDGTHSEEGEQKKLITALNETLKAEFRNNPNTFIYGQDMANKDKGGVFNVSKGMQQEFGIERVFNGPIAEDYITGTANGMSRFNKDIRVVIEGAEFADYFWPAMEQFVETTHEYWRTNGKFSPNVTIRLASGGYIGGGLYHSQNIEGALTTFPGIRIVYPSFADDAAGLLRTSLRSEGPTVFFEPKALYNDPKAATVIPDDFEVPFGKARIRRVGEHLTIVTYGNTSHLCIEAAKEVEQENNITIEIIDLRSLIPLDMDCIITSLKKTNRCLVVHEDKVFSGFGAEVAAQIADKGFELLDAPIKRVGSTFTPVGFSRILEEAILPTKAKIKESIIDIINY